MWISILYYYYLYYILLFLTLNAVCVSKCLSDRMLVFKATVLLKFLTYCSDSRSNQIKSCISQWLFDPPNSTCLIEGHVLINLTLCRFWCKPALLRYGRQKNDCIIDLEHYRLHLNCNHLSLLMKGMFDSLILLVSRLFPHKSDRDSVLACTEQKAGKQTDASRYDSTDY